MRLKIPSIILMIIFVSILSGCVKESQINPKVGKYYVIDMDSYDGSLIFYESTEANPYIEIRENNEIFFSKGVNYSYIPSGKFELEDNLLVFSIGDDKISISFDNDELHVVSATNYFEDFAGLEFILNIDLD